MKGAEVLQQAESHFKERLDGKMYEVPVPEWDNGDEKCVLFFKPSTLAEQDVIYKSVENGGLESLVDTILVRARDEDGDKMFRKPDRLALLRKVDPGIITGIVVELGKQEGIDIQEAPGK